MTERRMRHLVAIAALGLALAVGCNFNAINMEMHSCTACSQSVGRITDGGTTFRELQMPAINVNVGREATQTTTTQPAEKETK